MRDSAQGTTFYLGEVLIAEAHVRLAATEGHAACVGRDLTQALAAAILDAATAAGILEERIAPFVERQARQLAERDTVLLRQVEATRIDMETF
jgi:alpha-D-ribose 1-methylphosphonate 5-triphosphate synthase subunit PhnG